MADLILQGVRQTRTQALDLSGKNVRHSSPPQRTFPKDPRTPLDKNST